MDPTNQKQLQHLIEIEKKAEEILVDRNDIVSLDMKRNWIRESIRAVEKLKPKEKVWTVHGPCIIKLSKVEAINILNNDMVDTNVEINKKRSDIKVKVNDLRDLEFVENYKGFSLKPLNKQELSVIKHGLEDV